MKLETIPYLNNLHMLGSAPIPQNYIVAASHPVRDDNGRSGVLLQSEHTGLYTLYMGGKDPHMISVDQDAAQQYVRQEHLKEAERDDMDKRYEEPCFDDMSGR